MKKKSTRGQSLFEVVIALAISTIIIVSLVSLVSNSIRNSTFSKNKTLASRYAQEATEWLRGQRDQDPVIFKTNAQTTIWCLKNLDWSMSGSCPEGSGSNIAGTEFRREVSFNSRNAVSAGGAQKTIIDVDVVVKWRDSQGDHEVRSATSFSDWRER